MILFYSFKRYILIIQLSSVLLIDSYFCFYHLNFFKGEEKKRISKVEKIHYQNYCPSVGTQ
jgi:hypothetical protein